MTRNRNLIIIGAGGHGKVVADCAETMKKWDNVYFLDDNKEGYLLKWKIIGKIKDYINHKNDSDFIIAIGNNTYRENIQKSMQEEDCMLATVIHSNSVVGTSVLIGVGSVVMPGAIINSSTTIGDGSIINTNASVDHDCNVGDFVHISPGVNIAGGVQIGSKCWIGIGSTIVEGINIVDECQFGGSSLIIKDITISGKYYGSPVKFIEHNSKT